MRTVSTCTDVRALWTLGHSTRGWEALLELLMGADIAVVADVRRFPASRRHPQYAAAAMAPALARAGIDYLPLPALGGRRDPRPDSPNTGWRSAGFRGYADYMDTAAYRAARDRLAGTAAHRRTAILCAEADWRHCHRQLIADDFKTAGWDVVHLLGPGHHEPHPYSDPARVVAGRLDYSLPPPPQGTLF